VTALERATSLLDDILTRCREAGCLTAPMENKPWNVEAVVHNGKEKVKVLVYFNAKGVLTPKVQGRATPFRELVELQLHGDQALTSPFLPDSVAAWIGVDESGKGDYFGPIVAAAVLLTPESSLQLRRLLLRDSKQMDATRIRKAAAGLHGICAGHYTIVTVMPERYNAFMKGDSFGGNSQRILAWMHARCIENLLASHRDVQHAICDKFANEAVINHALMSLGRSITVHQHVRAEVDPAVAAASILARNEFICRMKQLEQRCGCNLPLGASDERGIVDAAVHILKNEGPNALNHYAKLHFRTTRLIHERTAGET